MRTFVIVLALFVASSFIGACQTSYPPTTSTNNVGQNSFVGPSPLPTSQLDAIEYRVTGTPSSVVVRYSNSNDGLTQVQTTLPFSITVRSNQPSVFLSLDAMSVSTPYIVFYPFLSVQIMVNGTMFREASSTNLSALLSINGTWRH